VFAEVATLCSYVSRQKRYSEEMRDLLVRGVNANTIAFTIR